MKALPIVVAAVIVAAVAARAQVGPVTLVGDNSITLNGERFANAKITFTKGTGDWYASGKDGHGSFEFTGQYQGRSVMLDFEWDGGLGAHVVTDEIRHNGQRQGEFVISMADKDTYGDGLNTYPSGDDVVTIKVDTLDGLNASVTLAGVITQGNTKVKLTGAFSVHRNTGPKALTNGTYGDCDPVVHDKLSGAEDRSPSGCEAKYDLDVRTAIHEAFAAALARLEKDGWEIQQQTDLSPLTAVPKGSERDIFRTEYDVTAQLSRSAPAYATFQRQMEDFQAKLGSATPADIARFQALMRDMKAATSLRIIVNVNLHASAFDVFKAGTRITTLAPGVYKAQADTVQATTGGDASGAMAATFLLVGSWKTPAVTKDSDGGEHVSTQAALKPALSHLAAQNVEIRIECGNPLADAVIQNLDLKRLQSILR